MALEDLRCAQPVQEDCRGAHAGLPHLNPVQNELNVALVRMLNGDVEVLHPFYTVDADLPFHLMAFQYVDCRETDAGKIHEACKALVEGL